MAKRKGAIVVDEDRCKGCNLCTIACPLHLIQLSSTVNHKGYNYAQQNDPELACTACTACATVCPDGSITVYRAQAEVKKP